MEKTAVIAGSTGLIGQELIKILSEDNRYDKILALTRKPKASDLPKVEYVVVDFDYLSIYQKEINADDAFCALGTTRQKAGSKEAFYKVDYTYVWEFGRIMAQNKAQSFTLVSSMGANEKSSILYPRAKGQIENFLKNKDFDSLPIFRPSQLGGNRREFRLGEQISDKFMRLFDILIPKNYKLIQAKTVAQAMKIKSLSTQKGNQIYLSGEITQIVQDEN